MVKNDILEDVCGVMDLGLGLFRVLADGDAGKGDDVRGFVERHCGGRRVGGKPSEVAFLAADHSLFLPSRGGYAIKDGEQRAEPTPDDEWTAKELKSLKRRVKGEGAGSGMGGGPAEGPAPLWHAQN